MNKTTMYAERSAYDGWHLHFNPGEAKEHNSQRYYHTVTFHHAADLDIIKSKGGEAFRAHYGDNVTDWYDTRSGALAAVPVDAAVDQWEEARVHCPWLFPMSFPRKDQAFKGEKGAFVRLNLHPEQDGITRGKICFPDRECTDKICSGPIVITGVKDHGNYGFFTGHMVQYEWPDDDTLLDYIENNGFMNKYRLTYVETEHFGKIVVLSERWGRENRFFPVHKALGMYDGELESITETAVLSDPGNDIRYVDAADMLCQKYAGCQFAYLINRFVTVPEQWIRMLRIRSYDKYVSDLMDDAVDSGIVSPMLLEESVFFYEFSPYGLLATIHAFSKEEVEEIVKTVNQTNMAAMEQIKGLAKRGKIRIMV